MVLIKQNIMDHRDQKSQQVVHKSSKNKNRFVSVLLQNLVSDIPGQSGHIWKKEPWVTLSLLTTWCKMHEGHLAPCFTKGWHVKDTALCLLFLWINTGLNTFKCIQFLHFQLPSIQLLSYASQAWLYANFLQGKRWD